MHNNLDILNSNEILIFSSINGYKNSTLNDNEIMSLYKKLKEHIPSYASFLKCNIVLHKNARPNLLNLFNNDPLSLADIKTFFFLLDKPILYLDKKSQWTLSTNFYHNLPVHIQHKKETLLFFAKKTPLIYQTLPKKLKEDVDISKAFLLANTLMIASAPESIKKNKEIAMLIVQKDGMSLNSFDKELHQDENLLITAINNDILILPFIDQEIFTKEFLYKISNVLLTLSADDDQYYHTENLLRYQREDTLRELLQSKAEQDRIKRKL